MNRFVAFIAIVCMAMTFHAVAYGQQPPEGRKAHSKLDPVPDLVREVTDPPGTMTVGQVPEVMKQAPEESRRWTSVEIVLSFSVLVFGAMVFALQTWLIVKMPLQWTPNAILRFNGLTLIITGAILLVTAGYSNEQMTPVIGLLGAIAGYLLGAADKPPEST